jgi:hypothetical protein
MDDRPTPSATPEALLGLVRRFTESRILMSAARLDVFTLLSDAGLTAADVAERLQATLRGTTVLLDALTAMGLLDKDEGRYRCPPGLVAALSAESPTSVLPMVLHSDGMWQRWSSLTDIVRRGPDAGRGPSFTDEDGARQAAFVGAMHAIGRRLAGPLAAEIAPGPARRLLDVGGALGTYTQAFLEASPALHATLFDLPPVIELARRRLAAVNLRERVTLVAGDFYRDELPAGHDLALLSAIIHQNGPEQNAALYGKVRRALDPGGRLVIRDHVMSPDRTRPRSGALFAVNMLVGTPEGGTYTFDEIRDGLAAAGFERIRLLREDDDRMGGLVEGFTPQAG